jgi:5-methylcytosine-specific restriction endonuclease McrA
MMARKYNGYRGYLTKVAKKKGVPVFAVKNWHDLAERLERYFGLSRSADQGVRGFCFDVMESRGWVPPKPSEKKKEKHVIHQVLSDKRSKNTLRRVTAVANEDLVSKQDCHKFYKSEEWLRVRKLILSYYGERCMACSKSKSDGVSIHVDHIKPLKRYWALRLDVGNLQVLCAACNKAKASNSEIDLRPRVFPDGKMALTSSPS